MRLLIGIVLALMLVSPNARGEGSIVNTKHNLSSSGPGTIKAVSEDRICIFCHTPHNATPLTPLWNRAIDEGLNYTPYDSTTFDSSLVGQPTGPSRLCLSCHDGTVGLGAVLSIAGGVAMTGELSGSGSDALLGVDLGDDHPVSFSYGAAVPLYDEIYPTKPAELIFYSGDVIHCTTCHDPHDDTFGMFLAVDNKNSGLCNKCHNVAAWSSSAHAISSNTWDGTGNNPWPLNLRLSVSHQRTTVAENGCENCHTPHNAGGPKRLMNYLEEEKNCTFACHNGNVSDSSKDISLQFAKASRHPVELTTIGGGAAGSYHDPAEDVSTLNGHVECEDCHDPHTVNNISAAAPLVNGRLVNVSGIDQSGVVKAVSSYEYEICFKCHGTSNTDTSVVTRYLNNTNNLLDFATSNPSFHPVISTGVNLSVPSLPSLISLDQTMSASTIIYCTDCHSSDDAAKIGGVGPNGPHGSIYAPILREQYLRTVGTPESYQSYALCYRCHDRDNILADASFQKRSVSGKGGHSGHLASGGGTPCSVCHDPHGIADDGVSGDHTNLINFDKNVVAANTGAGEVVPKFIDNGSFSGSCILLCHGVTHDGSSLFSYP